MTGKSLSLPPKRILAILLPLLLAPLIASIERVAAGDESLDDEQRIVKLVEQLGASSFAERERATEQLVLVGIAAEPRLRAALQSPSREVRLRSRRVLDVILENDFADRLEAFSADEEADGTEYGFPSWSRFRDMAGSERAAKMLFIEMQQVEPALMEADSAAVPAAIAAFEKRCEELREINQLFETQHPVPRIAALLFLASNKNIPLNRQSTAAVFELTQQPAFFRTMMSGPNQPEHAVLEKLLGAWIRREDNLPAFEPLMLGMQYDIEASAGRARAVLNEPQTMLYDRYFAVLSIAKFGDKEDAPHLAKLLDDATVCTRYQSENRLFDVQLRDVALAGLIHLHDLDPSDFAYGRLREEGLYVFRDETLGFPTDEEREAAIAKWRARMPE